MGKKIEVDTKTFIRFWLVILGFFLAILFVFRAATGLIIVGIAAFLAIAIQPLAQKINSLSKKKSHPALSSSIAFCIVTLVVLVIVSVISPVVVSETGRFVGNFSENLQDTIGGWEGINRVGQTVGIENLQDEIISGVQGFSSSVVGDVGNKIMSGVGIVANTATGVILTMVLTLLFLLQGPQLTSGFWKLVGIDSNNTHKKKTVRVIHHIVERMKEVIAVYVSRQVVVAILDGCITALAVFAMSFIFGFPPELSIPMGLITMIFYLIPMFGAIIGCVLVSLILFFSNPLAGIVFAIFYIVYQQVENNIIAPKIQGDALNMSPLIILIAITIGMYVFGLLGAIIAIPIAGCIKVLIEEYPKLKELQETSS